MKTDEGSFRPAASATGPAPGDPCAPRGGGKRHFWSYLLAFLAGIACVAGYTGYHISSEYRRVVADWELRQASIADERARLVTTWLGERQADADALSNLLLVRALLSPRPELNRLRMSRSEVKRYVKWILDRFAGAFSYLGVYVLDSEGHLVARSTGSAEMDPSAREVCRLVGRTGKSRIDLLGQMPEKSLLSLCVPVYGGDLSSPATPHGGPLAGVIVFVVEPARSFFPLLTAETISTRTGETLLVSREGNEVVYFSPLRHVQAGSGNPRRQISDVPPAARAALSGRESFGEFTDYRGARVLAATRRIPQTGWGLVSKIDREEALEVFRHAAWTEALTSGLLLLAFAGLLTAHRRHVLARVLREEGEKFRGLLESAPDAMVIVNREGRVVLVNGAAEKTFGYSRQELLGQPLQLLAPERLHRELTEYYRKYFTDPSTRQAKFGFEQHAQRKDGSEFPIEVTVSPIETPAGTLVCAAVRDITERKRAEQELRKLNRALKTLSECNQAMVRAGDESELLRDICRILVGDGGYRLVWVGYAEENETKSVRPVAQAGFDEGYVDQLQVTWADTERGRGPTGTAIRTAQPCVARSTSTDPAFSPWRAEATKRGYASAVALPLITNSKAFGALSIYATEPDAFDAEEVKLLTELANDLAYGIAALRTRAERALAKEALRQEERYRALVVATAQVVWTTNALGEVADDIPTWRAFTGQSEQDIKGWGWANAVHPDDQQSTAAVWSRAVETRSLYDTEFRVRRHDGEYRYLAARGVPVLEPGGSVREWVGTCTDITERKLAAERLRRANAYNRSLIEASLDPLVTIAPDGKITDVNRATEKVTGFSRKELIGTDFSDYFTDPAKARAGYKQVFREGWVQDYELEIRHRDGHLTPVVYNASVYRDETGEVIGMFAAARDISERKRAEEALRRASAYNRSLIEASLDPLVTISPDGKITDVNSATEKVTGFSRKELIGADFSDYFTDPAKARAGYQQAFREGCVEDYELEIRHRDGHITPVVYNASVYRDEAGEVIGVFAAARDITQRKRAEAEIHKVNAELTAANRDLEAFTYSVSHDLRAPLRHIDGFSKLLLEEYSAKVPEEARHYLTRVREGTRQMGQMVDDLLNLTRVGRGELKSQSTGLNSLLKEVLHDLKPELEGREIEWQIGPLPFVECEPALLKQVLANLLSNALKFTRPRERAIIEVGTTTQDGSPVIFVRDNGVGFSMKYADKLFGVFQRLHRAEDFEGTGVGLATVQRIVQKHGGRVWAEGELNKGASFYFSLGTPGMRGMENKSRVRGAL